MFPEGGWRSTGDDKFPNPYGFEKNKLLNPFRNGAFRLAIEKKIPVLPIALLNAGYKFSSKTMKIIPGQLDVYVFDLLHTHNRDEPLELNKECYSMIYKQLQKYTL